MESIVLFLILFGGFIVAFICLLYATLLREVRVLRWLLIFGAFCGLLYEGGCLKIAAGFGSIDSGSAKADQVVNAILLVAFLVAIAWCLLIIFRIPNRHKDRQQRGTGCGDVTRKD